MNDAPSTEKMFKNIFLEGNKKWKTTINTNLSDGVIYKDEFQQKQSRFFAYTRRNEDDSNLSSFSTNGIGNIQEVVAATVRFNSINDLLGIGDKLTQIQSGIFVEIGIITSIDKATGFVGFSSFANTPSVAEFCYATKNARVEGGEIRGYFMRVDLENDDTDFTELFAVNSNTAESYV